MIYQRITDEIVSRYIRNTLQREEVVQRTVFEVTELCEKHLVYLCRNISTGRSHAQGSRKHPTRLAWMTAARAVLALHDGSFNALFSAARATIANRCL